MAKQELFKNKFFAGLIRALGAFPVERGAGDGKAIKTGEDLIKEGNVMTIFIEGGRTKTGEFMRPRSGCALVAQQMQVPVIPACITITGNPKYRFAKRVIHFGDPLTPQQLGLTPDGDRRQLKKCHKYDYGRNQEDEGARQKMSITVAKSAGFCFGVNRAINIVNSLLDKNVKVSTLGPIIHNMEVVNELESRGCKAVDNIDEVEKDATLVIRSHGGSKIMLLTN